MTVGTGQRTVSKWCDYPERSKYLCKTHLLTEMLAYIAAITQPKQLALGSLGLLNPINPYKNQWFVEYVVPLYSTCYSILSGRTGALGRHMKFTDCRVLSSHLFLAQLQLRRIGANPVSLVEFQYLASIRTKP